MTDDERLDAQLAEARAILCRIMEDALPLPAGVEEVSRLAEHGLFRLSGRGPDRPLARLRRLIFLVMAVQPDVLDLPGLPARVVPPEVPPPPDRDVLSLTAAPSAPPHVLAGV